MSAAVVVNELVKTYPGRGKNPPVEAIRGISFTVEAGEFFGVLGPNGAGKTSTMGCITTLVRPTSGQILVNGLDVACAPKAVKRQIAVVPQDRNLDSDLKVREILAYHGRYFGLPAAEREARADRLLNQMGLADKAGSDPAGLSGGMQQRLMIARALMHDPKILLLDEPTNGLDPRARRSLWELVEELHHEGLTVLLTTHNMEEADRLCQRLAIFDHGQIVTIDTPMALKRKVPWERVLDLWIRSGTQSASACSRLPGVLKVEQVKEEGVFDLERFRLFLDSADGMANRVLQVLASQGTEFHHVAFAPPSLEDVYLHVTGKELRA